MSLEDPITLTITIRSDYHEETYTTATFQPVQCESYYVSSAADMSMVSNSFSPDLVLDLTTSPSAKNITWEPFTYVHNTCAVPQYTVTCTGPDLLQYRLNTDGTFDDFGNVDSLCSKLDYQHALAHHSITVDGSVMDDSFLGDYSFDIEGSSSLHSETATLSLVFSIICDCAVGANEQPNILYLINKGEPKSF